MACSEPGSGADGSGSAANGSGGGADGSGGAAGSLDARGGWGSLGASGAAGSSAAGGVAGVASDELCGERPGGSLLGTHVLRYETEGGSWVVQLRRVFEDWGVGQSILFGLDGFGVKHGETSTCDAQALQYVNTHHNWDDVARARADDLRYELTFAFDTPTTLAVSAQDGSLQLEPTALILTGTPGFCPDCPGTFPVSISELMTRNANTLADEHGDFVPWIELYNPSGTDVDLSGWALSNDFAHRDQWALPAITIRRQETLVLFADGAPEQGPLHTSFGLSPRGGELVLTAPDGTTDGGLVYPELAEGESFAWNSDVRGYVRTGSPIPGVWREE